IINDGVGAPHDDSSSSSVTPVVEIGNSTLTSPMSAPPNTAHNVAFVDGVPSAVLRNVDMLQTSQSVNDLQLISTQRKEAAPSSVQTPPRVKSAGATYGNVLGGDHHDANTSANKKSNIPFDMDPLIHDAAKGQHHHAESKQQSRDENTSQQQQQHHHHQRTPSGN